MSIVKNNVEGISENSEGEKEGNPFDTSDCKNPLETSGKCETCKAHKMYKKYEVFVKMMSPEVEEDDFLRFIKENFALYLEPSAEDEAAESEEKKIHYTNMYELLSLDDDGDDEDEEEIKFCRELRDWCKEETREDDDDDNGADDRDEKKCSGKSEILPQASGKSLERNRVGFYFETAFKAALLAYYYDKDRGSFKENIGAIVKWLDTFPEEELRSCLKMSSPGVDALLVFAGLWGTPGYKKVLEEENARYFDSTYDDFGRYVAWMENKRNGVKNLRNSSFEVPFLAFLLRGSDFNFSSDELENIRSGNGKALKDVIPERCHA